MEWNIQGSALLRIAIVTVLLLGLVAAGSTSAAACSGENVEDVHHAHSDENGDGEDDTWWYLYEYEDGSVCLESGPIMVA